MESLITTIRSVVSRSLAKHYSPAFLFRYQLTNSGNYRSKFIINQICPVQLDTLTVNDQKLWIRCIVEHNYDNKFINISNKMGVCALDPIIYHEMCTFVPDWFWSTIKRLAENIQEEFFISWMLNCKEYLLNIDQSELFDFTCYYILGNLLHVDIEEDYIENIFWKYGSNSKINIA